MNALLIRYLCYENSSAAGVADGADVLLADFSRVIPDCYGIKPV